MENWIVRMYFRGKILYWSEKWGCTEDRGQATTVSFKDANQISGELCSSDCSASAIRKVI